MTRDDARECFKSCGLTYADVTPDGLHYLKLLLDEQFILERKKRAQDNSKPQYWIRVNDDIGYRYSKEGKLVCAFMTGKGEYFEDREVISFNRDGFIGFCGSADRENTQPVLRAFVEWCNWLKKRKENQP